MIHQLHRAEINYRYDIVQKSPEWLELRSTRLGGSSAYLLKTNGKRPDKLGTGAVAAAKKKAAFTVYGYDPFSESFQSDAMARGEELEPIAVQEYSEETFSVVSFCGYVEFGPWLGYSPDGLVNKDGLIEVKCRQTPAFADFKIAREECQTLNHTDYIPSNDWWQMQFGLWLTGRKWCDYINYHPDAGLIIDRVYPHSDTIVNIETKAKAFVDLCESYKKLLNQ